MGWICGAWWRLSEGGQPRLANEEAMVRGREGTSIPFITREARAGGSGKEKGGWAGRPDGSRRSWEAGRPSNANTNTRRGGSREQIRTRVPWVRGEAEFSLAEAAEGRAGRVGDGHRQDGFESRRQAQLAGGTGGEERGRDPAQAGESDPRSIDMRNAKCEMRNGPLQAIADLSPPHAREPWRAPSVKCRDRLRARVCPSAQGLLPGSTPAIPGATAHATFGAYVPPPHPLPLPTTTEQIPPHRPRPPAIPTYHPPLSSQQRTRTLVSSRAMQDTRRKARSKRIAPPPLLQRSPLRNSLPKLPSSAHPRPNLCPSHLTRATLPHHRPPGRLACRGPSVPAHSTALPRRASTDALRSRSRVIPTRLPIANPYPNQPAPGSKTPRRGAGPNVPASRRSPTAAGTHM
ncbi:hypothetical protein C8Q79DRAFT_293143 [Trametes meyenii]|nr:hypothetical protein C8Q79DRAFT_293143 [Trametes meyenii]